MRGAARRPSVRGRRTGAGGAAGRGGAASGGQTGHAGRGGATTGTGAGGSGGVMLEREAPAGLAGDGLGRPRRLDREDRRHERRDAGNRRRVGRDRRRDRFRGGTRGSSGGPPVAISGSGGAGEAGAGTGEISAGRHQRTYQRRLLVRDARSRRRLPGGPRTRCSSSPPTRGGGDGSDGDVHVTSVVNPADRDRRMGIHKRQATANGAAHALAVISQNVSTAGMFPTWWGQRGQRQRLPRRHPRLCEDAA